MSSKRGRKRNDNLPPNRARDVQRAFRARRAAHLQALEQRVTELEEENNTLRQALNLPPANRQPLGKGPTGKDKPRTFESVSSLDAALSLRDDRDSSSSPDSTRGGSLSPGMLAPSMQSRQIPDMQSNSWDQSLMVNDQTEVPSSATSSSYPPLPSLHSSLKVYHHQQNTYPSPIQQHRNPGPSASYMPSHHNYPQTDRHVTPSSYPNGPGFNTMRDMREEPRSHSYHSYSNHSGYEHSMPSQSPPVTTSPVHSTSYHSPREPSQPAPYAQRRAMPEQQQQQYAIGHNFPQLPHPTQPHHNAIRLPSPPAFGHNNHPHIPGPRNVYGPDGRMNQMS